MNTDFSDWAVRKTVKIYLAYHHAIHARAQEGRPYILRALFAVLVHEGLKAEPVEGVEGLTVDLLSLVESFLELAPNFRARLPLGSGALSLI